MRETERLGLTQWDPTDRILREKFNDDNAKIDAALGGVQTALGGLQTSLERVEDLPDALAGLSAAVPGRLEVIKDVQIPVTGFVHSVTFSIDWNDWESVILMARYPEEILVGSAEDPVYVELGTKGMASQMFPNLHRPGHLMVFFPRHDASAKVTGFLISERFIPFVCDFTYSDIGSVFFGTMGKENMWMPYTLILGRR